MLPRDELHRVSDDLLDRRYRQQRESVQARTEARVRVLRARTPHASRGAHHRPLAQGAYDSHPSPSPVSSAAHAGNGGGGGDACRNR